MGTGERAKKVVFKAPLPLCASLALRPLGEQGVGGARLGRGITSCAF